MDSFGEAVIMVSLDSVDHRREWCVSELRSIGLVFAENTTIFNNGVIWPGDTGIRGDSLYLDGIKQVLRRSPFSLSKFSSGALFSN